MNGYVSASKVEARSRLILEPFLDEHSGGRFVFLEKGPLARALQETIGDVLMMHKAAGRLVSVEIKAEEKHTGNLFIECWSNLNLEDPMSWEERGSNPGWAWKLHPGLLFYHFLDLDCLYIFKGYQLWNWMHGSPSQSQAKGASRIHDFPKRKQRKTEQLNDTWGHLVPLHELREEVGYSLVNPQQLSLFTDAAE